MDVSILRSFKKLREICPLVSPGETVMKVSVNPVGLSS